MSTYYEYLYIEKLGKTIGEEEKIHAINELGKLKSIRAKESLTKLAINENVSNSIRQKSILALIEIGDKDFLSKFKPFSKITDEDILELIIYSVKKLNAVDCIEEFKEFIGIENKDIKRDILDTLNSVHTEEAIRLLIRFYNDKHKEIKNIIKLYLKDSKLFQDYIINMNDAELLNILGLIPEEKAEIALKKLIDDVEDDKIIRIIISSISELNLKDSEQIIEKLYNKLKTKEMKLYLIESLQEFKNNSKKEFLLKLLDSDDREIRAKALSALSNLTEDDEVMEKVRIMAFIPDEWWLIRKFAAIILANSKSENYLKELTALLEMETDDRIMRSIIFELGNIGNEDTKELLIKFLDHPKSEIKKVTMEALAKLGYEKILDNILNESGFIKDVKIDTLKILINFNNEKVASIIENILENRKNENELIEVALQGLKKVKISFEVLKEFLLDQTVKRENRAKAVMFLEKYPEENIKCVIKEILKNETEWWMLRKMLLILAGDLKIFSVLDLVLNYCNNLDERLAKTARETSKIFYTELLINKLNGDQKEIAEKFINII